MILVVLREYSKIEMASPTSSKINLILKRAKSEKRMKKWSLTLTENPRSTTFVTSEIETVMEYSVNFCTVRKALTGS